MLTYVEPIMFYKIYVRVVQTQYSEYFVFLIINPKQYQYRVTRRSNQPQQYYLRVEC